MTEIEQDRLMEELDRLGEDPPNEDESSLIGADADDAVDVAVVAALIGLAEPDENAATNGESAELGELAQARAWRKVAGRLGLSSTPELAPGVSARRRQWSIAAVGLAAAAAVTFIIIRPAPDDGSHEMAVALQSEARRGLTTLGVVPGGESARAQDMLHDYEARLATEGAG